MNKFSTYRDAVSRFFRISSAVACALGLYFNAGPAGGAVYYVNDGSTAGDVYTTAIGNDANNGLLPSTPKRTVTNLLAAVTLVPGDVVYIDTGGYSNYTVNVFTSGTATNPISFMGSTNWAAGGTRFVRNSATAVFGIAAEHLVFSHLRVSGGTIGFSLGSSGNNNLFDQVYVFSNTTFGFNFSFASGNIIRRSALAWNATGIRHANNSAPQFNRVESSVLWENTIGIDCTGIGGVSTFMTISNSVISFTNVSGRAYTLGGSAQIFGDYNALCRRGPAEILAIDAFTGLTAYHLSDWQNQTGQETHSTCTGDARFANPALLDFHPQSVVGRYNPVTGLYVTDSVHSVLIDYGPLTAVFTNEPMPNGGRLNIGMFGNTGQASLSRTNPWLYAASYNDGGSVTGTGRLYWTYGAFTNGSKVRLFYSPDNGVSWTNFASGVAVTNTPYPWVVTGLTPSLQGRWRVESEANSTVFATNRVAFTLRASTNSVFSLFVNDTNTANDVYCTAPGSAANTGLLPGSPFSSLQQALDTYKIGAGDTIYVDTGVYTGTLAAARFNPSSQGVPGQRLRVVGSTNAAAGGTILDRGSASLDAVDLRANSIELRHIRVRNARYAFLLSGATDVLIAESYALNSVNGFRGDSLSRSNRLVNNIAMGNTIGVANFGNINWWERGVCWSNTTAFNLSSTISMSVSNSVIAYGTAFAGSGIPSAGDHNVFFSTAIGPGYNTLNDVQKVLGLFWLSTFGDPEFANPAQLDFHPRSQAGRYDPLTQGFVNDGVTSVLIDFGSPADTAFTNEPAPNGGRVNVGAIGGTARASKSRTNAWLQTLTYHDGGQLSVPGDVTYWTYGNLPTGATIRIEYSGDAGSTWAVIATNIFAATGSYAWSNTNYPSSRFARWRVVLESDPAVTGASITNFTFRNGPYVYYVNDNNLSGDVYTTAPGNNNNLGTSPGSPKATLASILNDFVLDPGDVVYIDTGNYPSDATITFNIIHSGSSNAPVRVVGSTNVAAGGTVFNRLSSAGLASDAITVAAGVQDIEFSHLRLINRRHGLQATTAQRIRLNRVQANDNVQSGFRFAGGGGHLVAHSAAYDNGTGLDLSSSTNVTARNVVLWKNAANAVNVAGAASSLTLSNSILGAVGNAAGIYNLPTTSVVRANYNNYVVEQEAVVATVSGLNRLIDSVSAWQAESGEDANSLNTDPLFANEPGRDFHLKTETVEGRFQPGLGWVNDTVTSPLIDAGAPTAAYSNEPGAHGGRINIGMYGNTTEASIGRSTPWLFLSSLKQGGWVKGTAKVTWVSGNLNPGAYIQVEYSPNGGEFWNVLSTGVLAGAEAFDWNTTATNASVAGLVRIGVVGQPELTDPTTNFFAIRNAPVAWYVNDASTSGDVYSTGPGSPTNWVATAARPLNSLATVFSRYNIEPGDAIYVDTGNYVNQPSVQINRTRGGGLPGGQPVLIAGSTNCAGAGSVFSFTGGIGLDIADVSSVRFSNLVFAGASTGVRIQRSRDVDLTLVRVLSSGASAVSLTGVTNITLRRSVMADSGGFGVLGVNAQQVGVLQSILWSNVAGSVSFLSSSSISVSNAMLTAAGPTNYLYHLQTVTGFRSDYNNLQTESGAEHGLVNNQIRKLLTSWQAATSNDIRSLSHPPGFADPAAGHFYLRSQAGRFDPETCAFVLDAETSPMIDAGLTTEPFALESNPNGGRINLGLYGNHPRASRTPTNPVLIAVSYFSGGIVRGTNDLYWLARGAATGHTVRVEYSSNGQIWTTLATNIPASAEQYLGWDTIEGGSLPVVWWRVSSEQDPGVIGSNAVAFTINNGAIAYYVNDASTAGDVYTTAAGSPLFDGLDPSSPLPSLTDVLARYPLEQGDLVYIDTGVYPGTTPITFDANIKGALTNLIHIIGSTNVAAGGTVFDAGKSGPSFQFAGTEGFRLSNLRFTNSARGILAIGLTNAFFDHIDMDFPLNLPAGGERYGVRVERSTQLVFDRLAVSGATNLTQSRGFYAIQSTNLFIDNSVLWSNNVGIELSQSALSLSNSVIGVFGVGRVGIQGASLIRGEYNNLLARDGAYVASDSIFLSEVPPVVVGSLRYSTVTEWREMTGQGPWFMAHDPRFADGEEGRFFLRSQGGRYQPFTQQFVTDLETSPLVDAGDPQRPVDQEPEDNGGRINMGLHGNTAWASKAPTNASYVALTLNDGGVAKGTNVALRWLTRGVAQEPGHTVRIRYSINGGVTWSDLVTGLAATNRQWIWNTTLSPNALTAKWRVESELTPSFLGQSELNFAVRNTNFTFFVNNESTNGNVYTTAAGNITNTGLSAASPLPGLPDVLSRYDLEPGDVVYIDTGLYALTNQLVIRQEDTGNGQEPVVIVGSTNRLAGGTVFTGETVLIEASRGLIMRNITINRPNTIGGTAIRVLQSSNTLFEAVDTIGGGHGFHIQQSVLTKMLNCSAVNTHTNGLFNDQSALVIWEHGLLWSNRVAAIRGLVGTTVSNSVLGVFNDSAIYDGAPGLVANYNSLHVHQSALIARLNVGGQTFPRLYENVGQWSQETTNDINSLSHPPLFAGAGQNDFHPRSVAGRYQRTDGSFVSDAQTSPLIDAAGPAAPFDRESEPNGLRANIGRFGHTPEASRTPATPELIAVSFYDGGTARGTNVTLYWVARGAATAHTFRVEFSPDDGQTWSVLASNLPPGSSSLTWDSSSQPSTVLARWRIVSETDGNVTGELGRVFAVRNGPVFFYVNDTSTTGDVYTVAAGSVLNRGTAPSVPKRSVRDILTTYELEAGDIIYVDTGYYALEQTLEFDSRDVGSTNTFPLAVIGSTNRAYGGTVFDGGNLAFAISLVNAQAIALKHLEIRNASTGIRIVNSPGFDFQFVTVRGSGVGISVSADSGRGRFRNCVIRDCSGIGLALSAANNITWHHGVLWSNAVQSGSAVSIANSSASFSNSVFVQFGTNAVYAWNEQGVSFSSDYNLFSIRDQAVVSSANSTGAPLPMVSANVSRWVRDYGKDRNSLSGDPLFFDPVNGDFHPRSEAGRFHVTTQTFVNDTNTSLLVDNGAPSAPFELESAPNGGRVNIGLYGNTAEASRSPSSSRLLVVNLRDGGRAQGENFPLTWRAIGPVTGHTVRLEFSSNNGVSWSSIITGLPARVESYFWNTTVQPSTWAGRWRVVSEADPAISGVNDKAFAVRNTGLALYLNDTSTNGLVYCTAPGNPLNDGLTPATPRLSLQSLLDDYDLDPGDTIYMDTGTYISDATIQWGGLDAWDPITNIVALKQGAVGVTLQGSTNELAGGSRMIRVNNGDVLLVNRAYGVAIRNVRFINQPAGTGRGLDIRESPYTSVEWVRSSDAETGVLLDRSDHVAIRNTVISGAGQYGLLASLSSNTSFRQGVLWSNAVGARVVGRGAELTVENSVLGILRVGHSGLERVDSGPSPRPVLFSDYNVFFAATNAFLARLTGGYPGGALPFLRLIRWNERAGLDLRSSVADPRFANPGAGDFHPTSPHGRFVPGVGYVTNAFELLSPLIDAGNPASPFAKETAFNGFRANIGLYGHSPESSISPTGGTLRILTFNDGGSGFSNIWLRWTASGPAVNHTVAIDFSNDGGATWEMVVTNYPASAEAYLWDSVPYGRAAAGVWRMTSEANPGLTSQNQRFFALRQDGTVPYYVNDASTVGDVYTTAPGNPGNDGLLPSTPKSSLQDLINEIELEPGDLVYIDTGVYANNINITIGILDAGEPGNPVILRGSTNIAAGGTVIDRITGVGSAILVNQTEGIRIENMTVRNAGTGIVVADSNDVDIFNVVSRNNTSQGIQSSGSAEVRLRNSLLLNNLARGFSVSIGEAPGRLNVENSVVWGSPISANLAQGCSLRVTNSVLHAFDNAGRIFDLALGAGDIVSDYNNYIRESGALMAERRVGFGANEFVPRLIDWQRFLGQDARSLSHPPLFADPIGGDFHPRSSAGRFTLSGSMTNDLLSINSPLIDTGNPGDAFANESSPNGGRINVGRYGNTWEASLSRTNPWLLAVSVNDGGRVSGTQLLYWVAGNVQPTNTVRLEYARNGVDYSILASNVPALSTGYPWDASTELVTQLARWRVILEGNETVNDAVDNPFIVKNETLIVYVNDASTAGDVYCFASCNSTNTGLTPFDPLCDPVDAFERYPFGGGDIMYIDTGNYTLPESRGLEIGLIGDVLKSGLPGWPITIQGSTNHLAGGTRLIGVGNNSALITLTLTKDIALRDLRFSHAGAGIRANGSERIEITQVQISDMTNGVVFVDAKDVAIDRAAIYRNTNWAFIVTGANSDMKITHSVMAHNFSGAFSVIAGAKIDINRSILDVSHPNAVAYLIQGLVTLSGDFNMIWTGENKVIALNASTAITYPNLRSWQRARNMDFYSIIENPLFADAANGDFHLRSQEGRYQPGLNAFAADAETSWAIDAGTFGADFSRESFPNGGRVNMGLYGNTEEASRSVTNPVQGAVRAVTVSDGGTISGSHLLYWQYWGIPSNALVRLEYSPNDGELWLPISDEVPVGNNVFMWDFSEVDSTPLALWRITVMSNSNITDRTDTNFTIRNGPIDYYVNDTNVLGDVFTTAPGYAFNNGITPSSAMHSVSAVLNRYALEDGDTVYVDTGYYEVEENIRILGSDSGSATNRVVIRGSTNRLAGGTVIRRIPTNEVSTVTNTHAVFELFGASFIELRDMTIERADYGISITGITGGGGGGHLLRNLLIRDGVTHGIFIDNASSIHMDRIVITRHFGSVDTAPLALSKSSGNIFENSIIWSNAGSAIVLRGGLSVSNCVLNARGAITDVIYDIAEGSFESDYNVLYVEGAASYATDETGFLYSGLPQWNQATLRDRRSLAVNPRFADPANDDYHPVSAAGRYDPQLEDFIVVGTNYSRLIDTGAPGSLFDQEPMPNGGRRNIGLHGGTPEASKSRTNEWLLAITAMAGGRASGIIQLFWTSGNLDATNQVRLEYSPDAGTNWLSIAENVPISQDGYFWDSTTFDPYQSPIARWRVMLQGNTNVSDVIGATFGLNGPFTFYVNNDSTNQNLYTTAPGNNANLGISSNAPKASLQSILDDWDVDPEDIILIDTGHYMLESNTLVKVRIDDQGAPGVPVTIRGSTNAMGTILNGINTLGVVSDPLFEATAGFLVVEHLTMVNGNVRAVGSNIVFRHMTFTNSTVQVAGNEGRVEYVQVTDGSLEVPGNNVVVSRVAVRQGSLSVPGNSNLIENSVITATGRVLITVSGKDVIVRNNTAVGGPLAVRLAGVDSSLQLYNNILVADRSNSPNAQVISREGGTLQSDYNILIGRNGAWIGNADDGLWEKVVYWQERSGQDTNSFSADPLFANEAGGDFHVRSSAGRFLNGAFVLDGVDSPAIDAGSPQSGVGGELTPNGGRINIGAYGGTEEASKSRTSPWLYALTMNDGGVLRGTNTLRWIYGGLSPTSAVTLQYSANGGSTWTNIAANIQVGDGSYVWDTTTVASSLDALWRVVLEADLNIVDQNNTIFNLRNDVRAFYVNNPTTSGNVFTTMAGSPANDGRTPATPKATLEDLLATYDTEPFDVVYVDTGIYTSSVINVIWSRGGDTNGNMVIRGSTNTAAGGTVIRRIVQTEGSDVMRVQASHVTIRDLVFENANRGLVFFTNRFSRIEEVEARGNRFGIVFEGGGGHTTVNARVWNNSLGGIDVIGSTNPTLQNITFVNNLPFSLRLGGSNQLNAVVQNNIFYHDLSTTAAQFAVTGPTGLVLNAFMDYNVYYFGPLAKSNTFIYGNVTNLLTWQRTREKDYRSAMTNPLLHNVTSGDFHLRSEAGRYDPISRVFVSDAETSWAIDKGNPFSGFSEEPAVNGGRVNIGAYGNTMYASKGRTNQIVFNRTANEPLTVGEAENPYPLIWHLLNVPFDFNVSVQYSGDGGNDWLTLQSGVPAYQEYIIWTNSPTYNSFNGQWRIVGEGGGNTNYWDINDGTIRTFFGVHRISSIIPLPGQATRIVWRGAWDEDYQIQFATNNIGTNRIHNWHNLVSVTNLVIGGDTPFIDAQASNDPFRVYRVIWLGTNGVPYQ